MASRNIGLAVTALALAACSQGVFGNERQAPGQQASGPQTERSFANRGFDRLQVQGSDDVTVRTGQGFAIVARGERAALDALEVVQQGSTLTIRRRRGTTVAWDRGAKVTVTMPALRGASLDGSADVAIDRATGDVLSLAVQGSGDMSVERLSVRRIDVGIAGSGDVTLAGTADRAAVSVRGSGNVDGSRLRTRGATVAVKGSGGVRLPVDGQANVTLAGSGDIDLGPAARCTTSRAGSGTVRCGG